MIFHMGFNMCFHIVSIILFNLALYYKTIFYGHVIDDIEWVKKWSDRGGLPSLWHDPMTRLYGAGTISFNPIIDHLTTLSLHTISSILIYFMANIYLNHSTLSLIVALLWSSHPTNHSTAVWLTGRRYQFLNILAILVLMSPLPLLVIVLPLSQLLFCSHSHAHRTPLIHDPAPRKWFYHSIIVLKLSGFALSRSTLPVGKYQVSFLYPFLQHWRMSVKGNYHAYQFNYDAIIGSIWFIALSCCAWFYPDARTLILALIISTVIPSMSTTTQLVADRYYSITTIIICLLLTKIFILYTSLLIFPLFVITFLFTQVYKNIKSFQSFHSISYPHLLKLPLFKLLYP
jgi:hypothetical protein